MGCESIHDRRDFLPEVQALLFVMVRSLVDRADAAKAQLSRAARRLAPKEQEMHAWIADRPDVTLAEIQQRLGQQGVQ